MSTHKRYFLELSYLGKPFHGWQVQENAVSIQGFIEEALTTYLKEKTTIQGSGRTDTGVNASFQVCHFETHVEFEKERLIRGLNGILPKEIAIHAIRQVKPDAHARFDAIKRSYTYRIIFRKNPFLENQAWLNFTAPPNVELMNQAAAYLLEYDDFECFSKVHTEVKHFRCQIFSAFWEQKEGELLFHITANRFLRGMVRAIVGTLLEIGQGKRSLEEMPKIIESKSRSQAGKAAPASGLFLSNVTYPDEIYLD
ncbi:tRNA pseudouridine(38-40) synthase TruA [Algoriphagus namhaensis]|uniref:tRNA pseudouridine synthase A n=1 Tax=Algoriphagus namhaensis TaxID=915353 RepID=A0ABV8ATE3_9BACT